MELIYISEQDDITQKISSLEESLNTESQDKENVSLFVEQMRKYTPLTELTREVILDLIEKIIISEPEGEYKSRNRVQEIEIFYRFIGKIPN